MRRPIDAYPFPDCCGVESWTALPRFSVRASSESWYAEGCEIVKPAFVRIPQGAAKGRLLPAPFE